MNIKIKEKDSVFILNLSGNIDINSSEFIEVIGKLLNEGKNNILCNMEDVNLIDYIGISIIAVAYKNVLNKKGVLKFCNIPIHIKKIFDTVGLNRVTDYYNSEESAILSFHEDKKFTEILKQKLRRKFKRIPFISVVKYRRKNYSAGEGYCEGKVLNLSAVGLLLVGEKVFPPEEIIEVSLDLRGDIGVINLEAKIIWVVDREFQPYEYPAMGIEFYHIDSKLQEKIAKFVDKNLVHGSF